MKTLATLVAPLALIVAGQAGAQSGHLSFGLGAERSSQQAVLTARWLSEARPSGLGWGAGVLATNRGSLWVGAGVSYTVYPGDGNWFLRGTFMPGLYHQGNGIDLGHAVEFATGIEVGTQLRNGAHLSLLLEHRSNADLSNLNPGFDTLSVMYSVALD